MSSLVGRNGALDSDGNLLVSDDNSGDIYSFDLAGVRTTFASGLENPAFLTFEPGTSSPEPSSLALLGVGAIFS